MITAEEIQRKVTRSFLVGIQYPAMATREAQVLLDELEELVENLSIPVVGKTLVHLRQPNPALLVGSGKAEEILAQAKAVEADVIVFDDDLSPAQQRNWEAMAKLCVIDRQEVILDIFAERAQTREAILQVALARMEYSLPRLKRAWTHLSRQRGGGTSARGQGETQLESDRRLVNNRIAMLRRRLTEVRQQRAVQRSRRLRKPVPVAAIIGYTNAGKSSLLNALTQAGVLAADKLFATLDPTTRQLQLPGQQCLLLTDTVGFVRRLPHGLVEAFKATLEETVVADLLLHVIDVTSEEWEKHRETTLRVMEELGAADKPVITLYNKSDLLPDPEARASLRLLDKEALLISARTGEGLDELRDRLAVWVQGSAQVQRLLVPHDRYDIMNRLHRSGGIQQQFAEEEGVYFCGVFPPALDGVIESFRIEHFPEGRPSVSAQPAKG